MLALPAASAYTAGLLYARLSDTRNPNEISIERQIENGHAFFAKNNIAHDCNTDHYVEPKGHRSGWSDVQRPAYRKLRRDVVSREHKVLVWCQVQERFTRAEDATAVIRHWIEDLGVDLVFDATLVSLVNFEDWLSVHTKSYIHSMESRLGKERMRKYFKTFYDSGAEHRRHPIFGLKIEGRGRERHNVANPETLPTVVAWLEQYQHGTVGAGTRGVKLARALGLTFLSKQHEPREASIQDLVSIVENLEHYKDFIPKSLYARCMAVRAKRMGHHQNHAQMKHPPLLLRGILRCGHCQSPLYQSVSTTAKRKYYCYRHPNESTVCAYRGVYRAAKAIDAQAVEKLGQLESISPLKREHIIETLTKVPRDLAGERRRAEREALLRARQRLMDGWLTAGLSPEEFRDQRKKIDTELEQYPDAPVPTSRLDRDTANLLFKHLGKRLLRAREFPEEGNAMAHAFFRLCEYDYETRKLKAKFTWE